MEFTFTGSPLSEIADGLWDLQMHDGTTVLTVVDRGDGGVPRWSPLGKPGAVAEHSTDWSGVAGAVAVSMEEAARRAPDLGLPAHVLGFER